MDTEEKNYGSALETAELLGGLHTKWDHLKKEWKSLKPADNDQRHSQLVEDTLNLTVYVADTSNLTLDPELDTY
ncbi:hypothetical protein D3C73_1623550 [compost metagenome]